MMKNRWHRVLAISLLLVLVPGGLLLLSRVGPTASPKDRLILTGSSTVAPLAAEIGRRFEEKHPGVRVDVQSGGSSRGIADTREGLADIGMSSRALKDSEKDGLRTYVLAQDGVTFLVHQSNPIDSLSHQQILDIYTGSIDNWMEVGGHNAPITVVNRAHGRSELELFTQYFKVKPMDIKADLVSGENQHGIKTVSGDPNAIIYMSVGTSEYEAAHGAPIKLLPLNGVTASTDSIGSGDFPLSRPLILMTNIAKPKLSPLVKAFLDFALSDEVHDLVKEQSFVPVE